MKPILKLYLKIFLFTGLTVGFVLLISNLLSSESLSLWESLFQTVIFGIIMSVIAVSLQWYHLKMNGIKITDKNLRVNHTRILKTDLCKAELVEKLKIDPITRRMKITENENEIILISGVNLLSWGDKIKILLKSQNKNSFEFLVSSRPRLFTTVIDYGTNLENVTRIEHLTKNFA